MSEAGATARRAVPTDARDVARLYRLLDAEMSALRPMWHYADGLPDPLDESVHHLVTAPEWEVVVGLLDDVAVGFLAWREEDLLPQAAGARLAAIRYIFTEEGARRVGVGEAMMTAFYAGAAARHLAHFDAHVSPGHREAKNFFEANGFRARSIVMHRGPDE